MTFDDIAGLAQACATRGNTADEKQRAALYVASRARGRDDARALLDALGLLPACPKVRRASLPVTTTADVPINTTTEAAS